MNDFKATDKWYKDAAENETGHDISAGKDDVMSDTKKTAEQFKQKAELKNITHWPVHDCSMCGYECGYIFNYDRYDVVYDNGCYCTGTKRKTVNNWEDVAGHYNLQTHPDVIKEMDKFWGFSE